MHRTIENIFLIDDDPIHQQIAKMMIDRQDIPPKIQSFQEAELALEYLKTNASDPGSLPDLILLDLNMPIMDGWDFLDEFEKIRNSFSKPISIHVLTSSVNEDDVTRATKYSSVSGYLVKPMNRDAIAKLLN
ncbi:MAG TPA: response regulator [Chitinophagaceae bacterium]|nr:response regulator [Chitinophagaceae bacterium]